MTYGPFGVCPKPAASLLQNVDSRLRHGRCGREQSGNGRESFRVWFPCGLCWYVARVNPHHGRRARIPIASL